MRVLGEWESFLHQRDELPLLVQCALMHYQFETIHPFLDENGRIGRLLIVLLLCERGALPEPLLYLSAFFEHHRDEYYNRLLAVSREGDWMGWLTFFLRGVIQQSEHAITVARHIVDKREEYRRLLQADRASASVLDVLELVFMQPYLTIQQISKRAGITFNTANRAISQLERLEIVEEITGQQRNRIYMSRQLLMLLSESEPIYRPGREE